MAKVTSADIARRAGVSRTTVSFVLNRRAGVAIPVETRERVLEAARALKYVPHAVARGLVTGRTQVLGISCRRPTDPHYAGLLDDLLRGVRERGYHLLVFSGENDNAPKLMAERRIDGVIVVGTSGFLKSPTSEDALFNRLAVFVGPPEYLPAETQRVYSVEWDDADGSRQVARHFLALGHERAAVLAGVVEERHPRVRGFLEVFGGAGRTPEVLRCDDETNPYEAGRRMLRRLRQQHPEVTAVFCRNDLLATGALASAYEQGLDVPGALSVAGYSNVPLAAYTVPSLTTVATPIREAGQRALDLLIDILDGRSPDALRARMPVKLLKRKSTGRPEGRRFRAYPKTPAERKQMKAKAR